MRRRQDLCWHWVPSPWMAGVWCYCGVQIHLLNPITPVAAGLLRTRVNGWRVGQIDSERELEPHRPRTCARRFAVHRVRRIQAPRFAQSPAHTHTEPGFVAVVAVGFCAH